MPVDSAKVPIASANKRPAASLPPASLHGENQKRYELQLWRLPPGRANWIVEPVPTSV